MIELLHFADIFLVFFRDRLVPFLTSEVPTISIPWLYINEVIEVRYLNFDWPFGGSIAQFLISYGILLIISVRIYKLFKIL